MEHLWMWLNTHECTLGSLVEDVLKSAKTLIHKLITSTLETMLKFF